MLGLNALGINGGYTSFGPSAVLLHESLEACRAMAQSDEYRVSMTTEVIHLCNHVTQIQCPEYNFIREDLMGIVEKMMAADIVIFSTSVIWHGACPHIQQFIAEITPLEHDWDYKLNAKVGAAIAHAQLDGGQQAAEDIIGRILHFGFSISPHGLFYRNEAARGHPCAKWQEHDHTHKLAPNTVLQALAFKKANQSWF